MKRKAATSSSTNSGKKTSLLLLPSSAVYGSSGAHQTRSKKRPSSDVSPALTTEERAVLSFPIASVPECVSDGTVRLRYATTQDKREWQAMMLSECNYDRGCEELSKMTLSAEAQIVAEIVAMAHDEDEQHDDEETEEKEEDFNDDVVLSCSSGEEECEHKVQYIAVSSPQCTPARRRPGLPQARRSTSSVRSAKSWLNTFLCAACPMPLKNGLKEIGYISPAVAHQATATNSPSHRSSSASPQLSLRTPSRSPCSSSVSGANGGNNSSLGHSGNSSSAAGALPHTAHLATQEGGGKKQRRKQRTRRNGYHSKKKARTEKNPVGANTTKQEERRIHVRSAKEERPKHMTTVSGRLGSERSHKRLAGVIAVTNASSGYIPFVSTRPQYRRQGLGAYLLHAALEWIRVNGGREATLIPLDFNSLLPFYLQFGFRPHQVYNNKSVSIFGSYMKRGRAGGAAEASGKNAKKLTGEDGMRRVIVSSQCLLAGKDEFAKLLY